MHQHSDLRSTVGGLAAVALWSTTFAFARSLSEQIGSLTAGAAVYLAATALCFVRGLRGGNPLPRLRQLPALYVFGCGALFVFYTAAIYLAVGFAKDRQQLLEVALINYLWPALTILCSLFILHNRAKIWLVPGTLLALTGVFLVMTQGAELSGATLRKRLMGNPLAYALSLAAAISWGLYSNLVRRWRDPAGRGAVEFFLLVTGLVLLAFRFLSAEQTHWNVRATGEVAALGAVTAMGYVLWDVAMRKGNLVLVVAFSYCTPLFSTVLSSLYLNVIPSRQLWTGCVLLVAGSLITWRSVAQMPSPGKP